MCGDKLDEDLSVKICGEWINNASDLNRLSRCLRRKKWEDKNYYLRDDSADQTTTIKRPRATKASKKPDSAAYVGGDVLRGNLHVHKYSREFKIPSGGIDEILAMEKVTLTKN